MTPNNDGSFSLPSYTTTQSYIPYNYQSIEDRVLVLCQALSIIDNEKVEKELIEKIKDLIKQIS